MKTLELTTQKINELQSLPDLKRIDLKELTGALKDLKTSMENVGSTINVIGTQNNTQLNITQEQRDKYCILRVKQLLNQGKLSKDEL
jgi:archaellum component FlaC